MQSTQFIKKIRFFTLVSFLLPLLTINSCLLIYKFLGNYDIYSPLPWDEKKFSYSFDQNKLAQQNIDEWLFTTCPKYKFTELAVGKNDKILGQDELRKTKKFTKFLIYFIRFHIYPNTKIVKTKSGNSILISLSNGEGWLMQCKKNNFEIEKSIFLGNKNKIINNESVYISGDIDKDIVLIEWDIERIS